MMDVFEDLAEAHLTLALVPHYVMAAWLTHWWDACSHTY